MSLTLKIATFMLFISIFDNTLTIPIQGRGKKGTTIYTRSEIHPESTKGGMEKIWRFRRQDPVVQPGWTADQGLEGLFTDYEVRVTDRKLAETEKIREIIQETVDEGTYAVELDESDFKEADSSPEESEAPAEPETEHEPEPEPEPEPQPEPKPEQQPEPEPEPEPEERNNKEPEPEPKKPSKKSADDVGRPVLAWLKKVFAFSWIKKQ